MTLKEYISSFVGYNEDFQCNINKGDEHWLDLYHRLSQLNQSHIHHHSPPSTSQSWHPGPMHPAECCHSYLVPQWSANGGAPLHSWGSRQHGQLSPLAKKLPQVSPVCSTPGTSDTAHTHTHDECYIANGTCNIIAIRFSQLSNNVVHCNDSITITWSFLSHPLSVFICAF